METVNGKMSQKFSFRVYDEFKRPRLLLTCVGVPLDLLPDAKQGFVEDYARKFCRERGFTLIECRLG